MLKPNDKLAINLMFIIVLFSSLTPLFLNTQSSQEYPVWFTLITRTIETIGSIILLLILKKEFFSYQIFKETILGTQNTKVTHHLTIATFSCIDIIMFSYALRFIDISTATLFYEIWTIAFIIWTSFLFKTENKYKKQAIISYVLYLTIFIGLILTIMAESKTNPLLNLQINKKIILGASIAFLAGIIAAIGTAHNIKYCYSIQKLNSINKIINQKNTTYNNLYCILLYLIISRTIITIIATIIIYITKEPLPPNLLIYAGIFGFTLLAPTALFSLVNLITSNLNVNALYYTTPAIALLWLSLTDMIQIPHPKLIIIGGSTIVIANLLLNLETALKAKHKIFIIILWKLSVIIYLYQQYM